MVRWSQLRSMSAYTVAALAFLLGAAPAAHAEEKSAAGMGVVAPAHGSGAAEAPKPGGAGTPAAATAKPATGTPKIVFETTSKDLGTFPEGPEVPFDFAFTNKGDADLKILNVQKSCGCTSATSTSQVVKPGESARIVAGFTTINHVGVNGKSIVVTTNDPVSPTVSLNFTLKVEAQVELDPPNSLQFGEALLGTTGTMTLKLTNRSKDPLHVTGVRSTSKDFSVRVVSPLPPAGSPPGMLSASVTDPGTPIMLEVTRGVMTRLGTASANIIISTNSKSRPEFNLWTNAISVGDLGMNPGQLFFGLQKQDAKGVVRKARIQSRAKAPFKILKLDAQGLPLDVAYEPVANGNGYEISVTYNGAAPEARGYNGKIRIETDSVRQPVLELTVSLITRRSEVKVSAPVATPVPPAAAVAPAPAGAPAVPAPAAAH